MKRAEIKDFTDLTGQRPLCVLGILNNPNGQAIAQEMRAWLEPVYGLCEVWHDGSQFELPALTRAKQLSLQLNVPVLYLHTRGAVNTWRTTIPTRKMWAYEFGVQWRKYFDIARCNEACVVCPFTDYDKETRYNGFVANPLAWRVANLVPSTDRMYYERLWCKEPSVRVLGTLIDGCADIKTIRKYLYTNYEN